MNTRVSLSPYTLLLISPEGIQIFPQDGFKFLLGGVHFPLSFNPTKPEAQKNKGFRQDLLLPALFQHFPDSGAGKIFPAPSIIAELNDVHAVKFRHLADKFR